MIHKINIKSKHPHGFLLPQGIGVLTFGILGLRVTGSILLSVSFLYPKSWEQKSTRALSQCHRRQEVQQRNTSIVPSASQHDYKLKQTCTSKKCLTTGRGQGDMKSLFKLNKHEVFFCGGATNGSGYGRAALFCRGCVCLWLCREWASMFLGYRRGSVRERGASLSGGYLRGRWRERMLGLGACRRGRGLGRASAAAPLGARLDYLLLKLWDHELQLLSGLPLSAELLLQFLPLHLGMLQTAAKLAQLRTERECGYKQERTKYFIQKKNLSTSDFCSRANL